MEPEFCNSSGFSAYHFAWDTILCDPLEPRSSKQKQALLELFPQDEGGLDERQFSRIHKCVLGIVGTKLEDELNISTAAIDDVDNLGRTPLHWAARRGDMEAVQLLLAYGAKCEARGSRKGTTPLFAAAKAWNEDVVRLLLEHGADVKTQDGDQQTPLMFAATNASGLECVKLLLAAGVDVNFGDIENRTPLIHATQNGCIEVAEHLLAAGADINSTCEDGWTALACSIFWNMHESIELLLRHGADVSVKSNPGETILHLAARYADETTLSILANHDIGHLIVDEKTLAGETVFDIAKEREEPLEWEMALENLMHSVGNRYLGRTLKITRIASPIHYDGAGKIDAKLGKNSFVTVTEVGEDDSDNDRYEDALEFIC
jgi:ankyrin repeat protein